MDLEIDHASFRIYVTWSAAIARRRKARPDKPYALHVFPLDLNLTKSTILYLCLNSRCRRERSKST